jgi:uncharacterized glyoxalase superfamily protein PhnB
VSAERAVDERLDEAAMVGGEMVKPPETADGGWLFGVLRRSGGHRWEVASNPFLTID